MAMIRALSALALAVPLLAVEWYAPSVVFLWVVLVVACVSGWEFQGLAATAGWPARRWDISLDAGAIVLAAWVGGILPSLVIALILMRLLARAVTEGDPKTGLGGAGVYFLGVIWIGGAAALVALNRALPGGREAVLFLLLVVWATDIGAYYSGRLFGKQQLAPTLSPGKTVIGAVGGIIASGGVGLALSVWLEIPGVAPVLAVPVAISLSVFAQIGDLCESMVKRAAGAKEASGLIPGHGGFLDRIDGLLFAGAPFYYFSYWFAAQLASP